MLESIYIITGASRGIGQALAKEVKKKGQFCIGVARSTIEENLDQTFELDLTCTQEVVTWISKLNLPVSKKIYLIHNAGTIEPVNKVGCFEYKELENNILLNLFAPMLLTHLFIQKFGFERLTIVTISSGAAHKPYIGWSAYCSTKAGLEMFSKTLALEYPSLQVISIAPGIVDTQMQKKIRETNLEEFPLRDRFTHLYESQQLTKPDIVAKQIYTLIQDQNISGSYDLRDIK